MEPYFIGCGGDPGYTGGANLFLKTEAEPKKKEKMAAFRVQAGERRGILFHLVEKHALSRKGEKSVWENTEGGSFLIIWT